MRKAEIELLRQLEDVHRKLRVERRAVEASLSDGGGAQIEYVRAQVRRLSEEANHVLDRLDDYRRRTARGSS